MFKEKEADVPLIDLSFSIIAIGYTRPSVHAAQ